MFKRTTDLSDIVLNKDFCATLGLMVQQGLTHAAHIAVNALVQYIQQAAIITLLAQAVKSLQALANTGAIVNGRFIF